MRRRTVIASLVLLAGALVARRRRRARAGEALDAAPAARQVNALAVVPSPSPAVAFVSVPWSLVDAPADRAELTVRYTGLPGHELDRADAQETPTQVFVTVLLRARPPAGGELAAGEQREATVALSAPLGARELVHAATDPPPPTGGEPTGPSLYP